MKVAQVQEGVFDIIYIPPYSIEAKPVAAVEDKEDGPCIG